MKEKCSRSLLRVGITLLLALLFALPAAAALETPDPRAVSSATELAQQYEAGGEIAVKGRLVLDQEMTFGGTQPVTIQIERDGCLIVRAPVTVDNPNLILRAARGGLVFSLEDNGVLTLKQGTAEVESSGIVMRSGGTLQTGSETNFLMSLTGDWANGVSDMVCDSLALEGITINGEGAHNSGVDRNGDLILRRCNINLTGEDSVSVRSAKITELTDTTLVPPFEGELPTLTPPPTESPVPTPSNPPVPPKGVVTAVYHKQGICVAVGAEPALPETMLIGYQPGQENTVLTRQQPVAWELSTLGAEPGVYLVKGQFTQEGLDAANLENTKKLTPTMKVLRYAEGGRMPYLWITRSKERLRVITYRPFGAQSVWLEYSPDGITWERDAENHLISDEMMDSISQFDLDGYPIVTSDPYPALAGYDVRVVVEGGIFDGTSESYRVGEGAPPVTVPTPEPNWSEGDRGGGGRDEPTRQEPPVTVRPTPTPVPTPATTAAPEDDVHAEASSEMETEIPLPTEQTQPTVTPITPSEDSWAAMALTLGGTAVVCTTVAAMSGKARRKALLERLRAWFRRS